jgi:hypothetical protein
VEQRVGASVGAAPCGGGGRGGGGGAGGAVSQQWPDHGGSGRATHARVCAAGAEQGMPESPTSGPRAIVTGGAGQKRFKPF